MCLVSCVVLASLTQKDDSPQKKYLIDATLQIQKQFTPTTSISQIRESYKSIEILCFLVKNENLFIKNAQILQMDH